MGGGGEGVYFLKYRESLLCAAALQGDLTVDLCVGSFSLRSTARFPGNSTAASLTSRGRAAAPAPARTERNEAGKHLKISHYIAYGFSVVERSSASVD